MGVFGQFFVLILFQKVMVGIFMLFKVVSRPGVRLAYNRVEVVERLLKRLKFYVPVSFVIGSKEF